MLIAGLTGCSDFRQAIGTEKSSPDEFEVVVRPPLSLPPGFGARPSAGDNGQVAAVSPAVPVQESELLVSRSGKAILSISYFLDSSRSGEMHYKTIQFKSLLKLKAKKLEYLFGFYLV